eukprot:Tamp_26444.p1 GENE.Tamp_26444~~Tamp_26444.p1  ORF type:complete len:196 (-),score=24.55 Tamp_26444:264-851(-)
MVQTSHISLLHQMAELKQLLKEQYKRRLWAAHSRAIKTQGRGLAITHLAFRWVLPAALSQSLSQRASPQVLKEVLSSDVLGLQVDVESSFESLLKALQESLRKVLLILSFPIGSKDGAIEGRESEEARRKWPQVQQAMTGFTYDHPRSARSKSVTNEESLTEMLLEFSREAAKDTSELTRPVLMAAPILSSTLMM